MDKFSTPRCSHGYWIQSTGQFTGFTEFTGRARESLQDDQRPFCSTGSVLVRWFKRTRTNYPICSCYPVQGPFDGWGEGLQDGEI